MYLSEAIQEISLSKKLWRESGYHPIKTVTVRDNSAVEAKAVKAPYAYPAMDTLIWTLEERLSGH